MDVVVGLGRRVCNCVSSGSHAVDENMTRSSRVTNASLHEAGAYYTVIARQRLGGECQLKPITEGLSPI